MQLEILSPEKTLFTGEVDSVIFPGSQGKFQILNNHAPIISSLSQGNIDYKINSKNNQVEIKDLFYFKNKFSKNKNTCILIGPEGDFTKDEVDFAIKNNISPLSLGDSRLRTETAGIIACHLMNIMYVLQR